MAGHWPSSFLRFYGPRRRKKRTRPISSHLDRTSLVNKVFIIWPKDYTKEFRFCGNRAGDPERARQAHLARSGSQSEHRIRFILPARRATHIIIIDIETFRSLDSLMTRKQLAYCLYLNCNTCTRTDFILLPTATN